MIAILYILIAIFFFLLGYISNKSGDKFEFSLWVAGGLFCLFLSFKEFT